MFQPPYLSSKQLLNGGIPWQILEAVIAAVDAGADLAHVAARDGSRGLRIAQHGVLHGHLREEPYLQLLPGDPGASF